MRIIVFGAAGDVGGRMVEEAVRRGHRVTAVTRRVANESPFSKSVEVLVRDVATATDLAEEIAGHDFAISSLRPPDGQESALLPLTQRVVQAAQTVGIPFLVVGGAAPLLLPQDDGHSALSSPDFLPPAYRPIATASQQQHDWCLGHLEPHGTYLCPPAMLAPGDRTETYRMGQYRLIVDAQGNSHISMEDFAIAALDEVESPHHQGMPFTVGY